MRKLLKQSGIAFRKFLLTFLAFWVSFIMPIFGSSLAQTVSADGPVPSDREDCSVRWYSGYPNNGDSVANDYECYIRGIFVPTTAYGYTHRITYSGGAPFWNFSTANPQHTQFNNQDATFLVRYTNSFGGFNIVSSHNSSYYNQTPSQPAIYSPQSLWELGPRTESLYTEFTCDYSGTGQGCSVLFRTDVYDPDFYNFLNSTIQVRRSQGGNRDFVRTNMGWEDRWITLNDGNWTVRGESCDPYVCSGWTSNRTFIVDTTAPSVVNMVAEPAYTTGTQNTVSANVSTDNIIGGVTYYFEAATDAAFTNVVNASGWIATNSFTFAALTDGQGYFYRGRSRDSLNNTNAWGTTTSSIQDATLPVLSNINITSQRFSPVNADGVEDDTEVSFDWVESNSLEARISIYNVSDLVNPEREVLLLSQEQP